MYPRAAVVLVPARAASPPSDTGRHDAPIFFREEVPFLALEMFLPTFARGRLHRLLLASTLLLEFNTAFLSELNQRLAGSLYPFSLMRLKRRDPIRSPLADVTFQDHCNTAVTHVRSQAAAIRKTTSEYLKGELLRGERLTNGDPKW